MRLWVDDASFAAAGHRTEASEALTEAALEFCEGLKEDNLQVSQKSEVNGTHKAEVQMTP